MNRLHPFLLPLMACVLACQEPNAPPTESPAVPVPESGGVRPVVVAEYDHEQTVVTIRLDTDAIALGAYQGRFRFDPNELELVNSSMPEDGYRVANITAAEQGEIRFAGFSIEPFGNPTALTLVFRNRAPFGPGTPLSVDLDVLGDAESQVVPERMIHAPERQVTKVVNR